MLLVRIMPITHHTQAPRGEAVIDRREACWELRREVSVPAGLAE